MEASLSGISSIIGPRRVLTSHKTGIESYYMHFYTMVDMHKVYGANADYTGLSSRNWTTGNNHDENCCETVFAMH